MIAFKGGIQRALFSARSLYSLPQFFFGKSRKFSAIATEQKQPLIKVTKEAAWNPKFNRVELEKLLPQCPEYYNESIAMQFKSFPGYFVNRTRKGKNLPIYLISMRKGRRLRTAIRLIDGSVEALAVELDSLLDLSGRKLRERRFYDDLNISAEKRLKQERDFWWFHPHRKMLVLRGNHVKEVKRYLEDRGF